MWCGSVLLSPHSFRGCACPCPSFIPFILVLSLLPVLPASCLRATIFLFLSYSLRFSFYAFSHVPSISPLSFCARSHSRSRFILLFRVLFHSCVDHLCLTSLFRPVSTVPGFGPTLILVPSGSVPFPCLPSLLHHYLNQSTSFNDDIALLPSFLHAKPKDHITPLAYSLPVLFGIVLADHSAASLTP